MTTSEIIQRSGLTAIAKGRMSRVGWYAGYLVIEYPASKTAPATTYIYGPNVAEAERDKLRKVPYPDSLLAQLKKKHQWYSHKVKHAGTLQQANG